jgi:CMP/dCMP kinase
MKYRVLTISREVGSGGGEIAEIIAQKLGWKLVDKELILEISRMEKVSANEVEAFDEKVDAWIHRITRSIWGLSADGISPIAPVEMFDAQKAANLAKRVIEEAHKIGNCVIVGRGAQCVLKGRKGVFHAFVYGELKQKAEKLRKRWAPGVNVEAKMQSTDQQRLEYIRLHYKENWHNPHLYDIMIDSKAENEKTADIIISAMQLAPEA